MTAGNDRPSLRLAADRAASKRRNYLLAGALLALALVAGLIIGVASTVLYFEKNLPDHKPRRGPKTMTESMLSRMEKAVTINDAEREELREVISDTMVEAHTVREEYSDRMRAAFADMNVDIARILGPERYEKWGEAKHAYFTEQAKRDKRHWYNRRHERQERERLQLETGSRTDAKTEAPDADGNHADE